MSRVREAIEKFLRNREADSPFLIPLWSPALETQVMTSQDGEQNEDEPGVFTADGERWKNIRWPYSAGSDPSYGDPKITFSPAKRVEKVGTTWWNWETKRSVAVGIDIDYEEDKSAATKTNTNADIVRIVERLKELDYVTIVKSTGGRGIHVYVFFDNQPEAKNHHEHTIVAKKTMELISKDIQYDLKSHVDCVGSVFWVWSKTSPAGHEGFSVVKRGGYLDANRLTAIELPTPAVRGRDDTDFETVEMDAEHRRILEAIQRQPYYFRFRSDLNLIHTHTCAIRDAVNELVHEGEPIQGTFETASDGTDPNTANCFLAPQHNGCFRVVRFGQSQHEPTWRFENETNYCYLNEDISFQERVSALATRYSAGKYFLDADSVQQLADCFGDKVQTTVDGKELDDIWAVLSENEITLYSKKVNSSNPGEWEKAGDKTHKRTIKVTKKKGNFRDRMLRRADDTVRYVVQNGTPRGWYHRIANGNWLMHRGFSDVSCVVQGMFGEFANSAQRVMLENPWELVQIPFEKEYPGGRRWNYNAPQLVVPPADSGGDHPHFDMILEHIGQDLDQSVQANEWCRKANIHSGADYLRTWVACLIHYTQQPLPYLFLVGPQNSGKSIFHEMTKFLFSHGVTSANAAITSGHNGELSGCFLVYVEERDLADKRYNAYERIKEWVTGRDLLIHEKYMTPYMVPNYLHFVQMANNTTHLPLEDGDTRIVAIDVPSLKNPVPKAIMEKHLQDEAPRFLRTLLNMVVPPPVDRLRIPAIKTKTKELMERKAMSATMAFAREKLHNVPGHKILFDDFYKEYEGYCGHCNLTAEPDFIVLQEVMLRSDRFTLGRRGQKQYLLNCTFDGAAKPKEPLKINSSGRF